MTYTIHVGPNNSLAAASQYATNTTASEPTAAAAWGQAAFQAVGNVSTLTGRALDRLASGIPSSTKGKTVHTKGRKNYYYENSLTCFPSSSLFSTTSTLLPRMYFGYEHCGDSEL
jgi:hypothetical protein